VPLSVAARLTVGGLRDELGRRRGRPPRLIPVSAPLGGYSVLPDPHVWDSIPIVIPRDSLWRNEVAARIALRLAPHRPVRRAAQVRCPLLVQIVGEETVVSNRAAARDARLSPRGDVRRYPGVNHFDIYLGEGFERLNADQVEFLQRTVIGVPAAGVRL